MSCFGRPATRMDICTIIINPVVHFVRPPVIVYLKLTTLHQNHQRLKLDLIDTMSINIQVYLSMCIVYPLTSTASILDTFSILVLYISTFLLYIGYPEYPRIIHISTYIYCCYTGYPKDYIYPPTSNILDTLSILGLYISTYLYC